MAVLIGSSAKQRAGRTGLAEWMWLDDQIASANGGTRMRVRRTYDDSMPSSWSKTPAAADAGKRISAYSFKTSWTGMAGGSYDSAVTNLVNGIPSGHTVYLTWYHEPENDASPTYGGKGSGNPADWRAGWVRFAQLVWAVGKPNVHACFNLMAFTWRSNNRDPSDWNVAPQLNSTEKNATVATLDGYGAGANATPQSVFGPALTTLDGWGFSRFGIQETGWAIDDQTQWANQMGQWIKNGNGADLEFACWWHSQLNGPSYFLDTTSEIRAWAAVVAGNTQAVTPPPVVPPGGTVPPPAPPPITPEPPPVVPGGGGSGSGGGTYPPGNAGTPGDPTAGGWGPAYFPVTGWMDPPQEFAWVNRCDNDQFYDVPAADSFSKTSFAWGRSSEWHWDTGVGSPPPDACGDSAPYPYDPAWREIATDTALNHARRHDYPHNEVVHWFTDGTGKDNGVIAPYVWNCGFSDLYPFFPPGTKAPDYTSGAIAGVRLLDDPVALGHGQLQCRSWNCAVELALDPPTVRRGDLLDFYPAVPAGNGTYLGYTGPQYRIELDLSTNPKIVDVDWDPNDPLDDWLTFHANLYGVRFAFYENSSTPSGWSAPTVLIYSTRRQPALPSGTRTAAVRGGGDFGGIPGLTDDGWFNGPLETGNITYFAQFTATGGSLSRHGQYELSSAGFTLNQESVSDILVGPCDPVTGVGLWQLDPTYTYAPYLLATTPEQMADDAGPGGAWSTAWYKTAENLSIGYGFKLKLPRYRVLRLRPNPNLAGGNGPVRAHFWRPRETW
jgi:hypothetical protein